jgi:flagellar basal-body rod protein FlgB
VDAARLLQEALRVTELNRRVIANNVANADTPNFTPTELDFKATLRAALEGRGRVSIRRTRAEHFEGVRSFPEFERLAILSKNDYNKVDLDHEMVKLSENTGRYVTLTSLLVKRFQVIKNMLNTIR